MSMQEKEMEKTVRLQREINEAMKIHIPEPLRSELWEAAEEHRFAYVFDLGGRWMFWKLNQPTKTRFPEAPID